MFLHGDILHLLSNMLFLWVFGDNVEDAMGHIKFLVFYLACGIAGGLAHALMLPASKLPLIGASGAVAGVIAAYLILHPRVMVWVLAFRFIPLADLGGLGAGRVGRDAASHGAPQSARPGGLVGAHRRHGGWRHPDPVHAPAGRAAVRSGPHAGLIPLPGRLLRPLGNIGLLPKCCPKCRIGCPIDTQLSRPYPSFRTCEALPPAVINET